MHWAEIIRTVWPIAATITPLILIAGFLWLQTKFALANKFHHAVAVVKRFGLLSFVRRIGGRHEQQPVRLHPVSGRPGYRQVRVVNRIEGPAEERRKQMFTVAWPG